MNAKGAANEYALAVASVGGATKLTAEEQAKVNQVVREAIDKYAVLGQEAPAHLIALERETNKTVQTTTAWATAQKHVTEQGRALLDNIKATAIGMIGAQAVIGAASEAW